MAKEVSHVFARRARLSSKAILTAVLLTLAALIATAIATREEKGVAEKELTPVLRLSPGGGSGALVPVIND